MARSRLSGHFRAAARLPPLDEVVVVLALVLRFGHPRQTGIAQQSLIGLRPERLRRTAGHGIQPFEGLSGGREEETPSGVERARHLLDDPRLRYWLEQEQEPPS